MLAVLTTYIKGVCNLRVPEMKGLLLCISLSSLAGKAAVQCVECKEEQKGEHCCPSQSDKHLRCEHSDDVIDGLSGLPCLDSVRGTNL